MQPFNREKRFKTRSVEGTLAIAATIAEILAAPRAVILRGEMGAGKTTLVKGWVAALGGTDAEVTSPTFGLVHEYAGKRGKIYHLDLYRLETERELTTLGLEEMIADQDALVLVEWVGRFESVMELADAEVAMETLEGDGRSLRVRWRDS